jgi:hypothetical protein
MCGIRDWDTKTRRIYAAAMAALSAGTALGRFEGRPWSTHHHGLYDGLHGLCIGVALGLLLCVLRLSRRCGPA